MIAATIASTVVKYISGDLVNKLFEIYKLRQDGKISEAEFNSRVKIASKDSETKIAQAWADSAAKITESVHSTVRSSPVIQRVYAITLFLQLFVLVWYQLGASAFTIITGAVWPAPMASIEWAYLLIAAMIGAGPLVYRK